MKSEREKIYITRPLLPDIADVESELKEIWDSKWVTNMGAKHNELEHKLKDVLKVKNVSLFNNGTIALLTAIKALNLPQGSEVITTPFTFAATPHCIVWNGLSPVFCDIEPETMCIDADRIEALITPKTSAILAVHVYGFPCEVEKIRQIADKYNLKVIYDAAHAFSTEINGKGIGEFGDITMFSFHATKLFNTIEGGCLTYNEDALNRKLHDLRNFGIQSEEIVEDIGINGKLNEIQAAIGLLNLKIFEQEQDKRAKLKKFYCEKLAGVQGIKIPMMPLNTKDSLQYFPLIIEENFKATRDEVCDELKKHNIITRKYFFPACSDYECYKHLPKRDELNVVNDIKNRVICLPFYGDLDFEVADFICKKIKELN